MLMKKATFVLPVLLLAATTFAACSDDTYIATNESLNGGNGGASLGGSAGSGGGANDAWPGGSAGLAGAAGVAGVAGAAGSGGGTTGQCTPGEKQDLGSCQKCGTSRRTCDATGKWGNPACEDQKDCNPGETAGGCTDPCAEKLCGSSCTFSACQKKGSAVCLYKAGSSWQCCGAGKWQYCSSTTCDWFPCQACASCAC
jgi:hypothetical protein